jgi:cysteine desulfurase
LQTSKLFTEMKDKPTPPIYLDYNATTPVDPAVLEAMLPICVPFGNPSSQHAYGQAVRDAVQRARAEVAELIGADADEVLFTSGGTEATNSALKGLAFMALKRSEPNRRRIVISAIEHPATIETAHALEVFGYRVSTIGVDRFGIIDLAQLAQALHEPALVVSLMHANNETGTLQPIAEAAAIAHSAGALLHVDAAQSAGKVRVDVSELGADLMTLAGHKLYAPKGVGALFIRRGIELIPLMHGAGQEGGRRAGTENVPYMVALGAACRIARDTTVWNRCKRCVIGWANSAGLGERSQWHPSTAEYRTLLSRNHRLRAARGNAADCGFDRVGLPRWAREHFPRAGSDEGRSLIARAVRFSLGAARRAGDRPGGELVNHACGCSSDRWRGAQLRGANWAANARRFELVSCHCQWLRRRRLRPSAASRPSYR